MEKLWQIAPAIDQEVVTENPDINPVVLQLLHNRGLITKQDIHDFLHGKDLLDPFLFTDMKASCQLIIEKIKAEEKIAIVGDYDADGVTASSVLVDVFRVLKAEVGVWIPSRLGEGYGLNKRIIDEIIADDCKLLITVDNGIKSYEEVAYAKENGLDVIITDHHQPPADNNLPDCLILNPMVEGQGYPYKFLAGVGVAFKLASALISLSKLDDQQKQDLNDSVVDLVAIGTVGDCVSLLGENRDLVKQGIQRINKHPRLGISELLRVAKTQLPITAWNIGWQIVPRLNVAGRLGHANTAYQSLIVKDKTKARELAEQLQSQNISRQNITKQIVADCLAMVDSKMKDDKILILLASDIKDSSADGWPEGVIGLVAGRLVEKYNKPAIVICKSEGQIKGSARSIIQFDMVATLGEVSDYLERYGGHKMAAGFTVKPDDLDKFVESLKKIAINQLADVNLQPQLAIDAELVEKDIADNLVDQLETLAPFGNSNLQPLFVSYGCQIKDLITMGNENQHMKLRLSKAWAIAFNAPDKWLDLQINDTIDIVYYLEWNYFNGRKLMQLRIIDIKYE